MRKKEREHDSEELERERLRSERIIDIMFYLIGVGITYLILSLMS